MALWRLGERDRRIEEDGRSAMWVCDGWVGEGEVGLWVSEDNVGLWVGEGNAGGLWWRAVPVSMTSGFGGRNIDDGWVGGSKQSEK